MCKKNLKNCNLLHGLHICREKFGCKPFTHYSSSEHKRMNDVNWKIAYKLIVIQ